MLNGWYLCRVNSECTVLRWFQDGHAYLCDPSDIMLDYVQASLDELRGRAKEIGICEFWYRGPVSQYAAVTYIGNDLNRIAEQCNKSPSLSS